MATEESIHELDHEKDGINDDEASVGDGFDAATNEASRSIKRQKFGDENSASANILTSQDRSDGDQESEASNTEQQSEDEESRQEHHSTISNDNGNEDSIASDGLRQNDETKDDDLEEGELKDDDDDDDDDDDLVEDASSKKIGNNFNNANDSNNNNRESSTGDLRHNGPHYHQQPHHHSSQQYHHNYPPMPHQHPHPHHSGAGQVPAHLYLSHHHRRQMSPSNQPDMMHPSPYPANYHHSHHNNNNSHYNSRYPPNGDGAPMPLSHPPSGPMSMYPRGGPGGVGPMHKVNARCRFYSKTSNKCTWGDQCRFEHRDDSPGPPSIEGFPDSRSPVGPAGRPGPPLGPMDRGGPYPGYSRHQPYPPPHGYSPYHHPHHSTPPPTHPPNWRQQHSPYPHQASNTPNSVNTHPPESVSPLSAALQANQGGTGSGASSTGSSIARTPVISTTLGSTSPSANGASGTVPPSGLPSPGEGSHSGTHPSPSGLSATVYERKHRLAYELAPWNDNRGGYPQSSAMPSRYGDRGAEMVGAPYGRSSGYFGRNPSGSRSDHQPPHGGGPSSYHHPSYHNPPHSSAYPSAYRGNPMGSHHPYHSHLPSKYSSQRMNLPPEARRSRSSKMGHDEDESSWSDSGSEDSILGQANKYHNPHHHHHHSGKAASKRTLEPSNDNVRAVTPSHDPVDLGGSGTPPGEPLPEDRERQEMLLNKLKEIEDLMAKKKGEQDEGSSK